MTHASLRSSLLICTLGCQYLACSRLRPSQTDRAERKLSSRISPTTNRVWSGRWRLRHCSATCLMTRRLFRNSAFISSQPCAAALGAFGLIGLRTTGLHSAAARSLSVCIQEARAPTAAAFHRGHFTALTYRLHPIFVAPTAPMRAVPFAGLACRCPSRSSGQHPSTATAGVVYQFVFKDFSCHKYRPSPSHLTLFSSVGSACASFALVASPIIYETQVDHSRIFHAP